MLIFFALLLAASPTSKRVCRTLEKCAAQCSAPKGSAEACFAEGQLQRVKSAKRAPDAAAARAAYAAGCEKGHARACVEHYELNRHGWGGMIDLDAAARSAQRACELGSAAGCAAIAETKLNAVGTAHDPVGGRIFAAQARAGLEKDCKSGDALSCWFVGIFGQMRLYPEALETSGFAAAAKALAPRCENDDAWACSLLGLQYELGWGVGVDLTKGVALSRRSCDLGDGAACNVVANDYANERGVAKDGQVALRYAKLGCDAGSQWACNSVCWWLTRSNGVEKDEAAARLACEKAERLLSAACELGQGSSCWAQAHLNKERFIADAKVERVQSLFAVAAEETRVTCGLRQSWSCQLLAWMHWNGDGVPVDWELAVDFERRACEAGLGAACATIAGRFEAGDAAEVSPARAKAFHLKACALGTTASCGRAQALEVKADETVVPVRCEGGQRASWSAPQRCCHPGQAWSGKDGRCRGTPRCAAGFVVRGETCIDAVKLRDEDFAAKLEQANKLLPWVEDENVRKQQGAQAEAIALEAVKLKPSDLRGYQALASALTLQDRRYAALEAYQAGLKEVAPEDVPKLQENIAQQREHIAFMEETERAILAAKNSPGYTRSPEYCGVAKIYDPWCAANGYAMPSLLPGEDPSDPKRRGPSMGDVVAAALREQREQQQRGGAPSFEMPSAGGQTLGTGAISATPVGNCQPCETVDCGAQIAACKATTHGQRACYEAAACVCECHRRNGGCGTSISFLERCIANNRANAARLVGSGTAVDTRQVTPPPAAPPAPQRDCAAAYKNCMAGSGGCAGQACAAPAEDPCVLNPGGPVCRCWRQREACERQ